MLVPRGSGSADPRPCHTDQYRHRDPAGYRGLFLSPDDPRLPDGRRRLSRGEGEYRRLCRTGRRRGVDDRLRAHRGGEYRRRCRRHHLASPAVAGHNVPLCLMFICFITLLNLRGVRESGIIFAFPTYVFVASLLTLIVAGLLRLSSGSVPAPIEAI